MSRQSAAGLTNRHRRFVSMLLHHRVIVSAAYTTVGCLSSCTFPHRLTDSTHDVIWPSSHARLVVTSIGVARYFRLTDRSTLMGSSPASPRGTEITTRGHRDHANVTRQGLALMCGVAAWGQCTSGGSYVALPAATLRCELCSFSVTGSLK